MKSSTIYAPSAAEALEQAPWAAALYALGNEYEHVASGMTEAGEVLFAEGYPFKAFESHADAQTWLGGFEPGDRPCRVEEWRDVDLWATDGTPLRAESPLRVSLLRHFREHGNVPGGTFCDPGRDEADTFGPQPHGIDWTGFPEAE